MIPYEFTALFPFCGLGAGARGFIQAMGRLGPDGARFRNLGGIDVDEESCADFRRLTGGPALCADLAKLSPAELLEFAGPRRPDAVFLSPPCKGFSGLLSAKSAAKPRYQALNNLVFQGVFLVLETWGERPPLIVMENVPRIATRGRELLAKVRQLLGQYGYVFDQATHDCGEIGGLAQHRRRFLLVARLPSAVPGFVYRPPRKRVRGCGEVLGELPLPGAPAAGELHRLPRLSWLNWVRLALIPAGGDWRDLPGQVQPQPENPAAHQNKFAVGEWERPARAVIGATRPGSGAPAVADPRLPRRAGSLGVTGWDEPAKTVTGESYPSNGSSSVADPRLGCAPRSGAYGVLSWEEAAATVTGNARVDNGRFAVADPRKPPDFIPVIIARDGTWHRPLTTLELAALQGLPAELDGEPLALAGRSISRWRERIGNAVPVQAGEAIAESLLVALLAAALGTWTLGGTGIWVRDDGRTETELAAELGEAA